MQILIDAVQYQVEQQNKDFANIDLEGLGLTIQRNVVNDSRGAMLENCTDLVVALMQIAVLHNLPLEHSVASKIFNSENHSPETLLQYWDSGQLPKTSFPVDTIRSLAKLYG